MEKGERKKAHHKLPNRFHVRSFEVSSTVPSPAPDCETRRSRGGREEKRGGGRERGRRQKGEKEGRGVSFDKGAKARWKKGRRRKRRRREGREENPTHRKVAAA